MEAASLALSLVATDTRESYLGNPERQDAIERRLMRYGEALKDVPDATLRTVSSSLSWDHPKRFRDLAAHWYAGSLSHDVIWVVLTEHLPREVAALRTFIDQCGEDLPWPV